MMSIKLRFLFFFLFISLTGTAQLTDIQQKISYYAEKAKLYLDKENALSGYYSIDTAGIKMYASAQSKLLQQPEFALGWDALELYKKQLKNCPAAITAAIYKSGSFSGKNPQLCLVAGATALNDRIYIPGDQPLSGYKIAIDAGHIANDIATGTLEKKHLQFRSATAKADSIEIAEGMLTYATVILLEQKLKAAGAQTFVTRVNGASAFGKTYPQWKKDDLKQAVDSLFRVGKISAAKKSYYLKPGTPDRIIFWDIFKDLELAKRASLINGYQPDFTIIVHYNVDETNTGWTKPTEKDLDMAFVGGAFMRNDLSSPEKRFEFFRLLVSDDLERSVELSSCMISSFEEKLNVPTAAADDTKYLREGCLPATAKGVYCRNLQLTRYIHSALVYGETLFQDNVNESKALSSETDKTKNERVQQVAEAYYEGVLKFTGKKNN